jgi:hypothetical protein
MVIMNARLLALAAQWLVIAPSAALAFQVVPLSNNATDDWGAAVSGSKVVWQGCVGSTDFACFGGHYEVFFWDGSFPIAPIQITNTGGGHVAISGSNVVFLGSDGGADGEVFFWDGSFPVAPIQITNNDLREGFPAISGSSVTWQGCDVPDPTGACNPGDFEIYYWDGSFPIVPVQVADNILNDTMPANSGSRIVWVAKQDSPGGPVEIYSWDGGAISQLTNYGDSLARWPDIWGSTAVWKGPLADGASLLLWNGVFPVATNPIPGSTSGDFPAISGSRVVWKQGPLFNTNIYLWDGQTITNVSNNTGFENARPDLSDAMVVWEGCAVHSYSGACLTDREIYMAAIPASPGVPSLSWIGGALLTASIVAAAMSQRRRS